MAVDVVRFVLCFTVEYLQADELGVRISVSAASMSELIGKLMVE